MIDLLFGKLIRKEVDRQLTDTLIMANIKRVITNSSQWERERAIIINSATGAVAGTKFHNVKKTVNKLLSSDEMIIKLVDEINKRQIK